MHGYICRELIYMNFNTETLSLGVVKEWSVEWETISERGV